MANKKYIIELDLDTGKFEEKVDGAAKSVSKVEESTVDATGAIDKFTNGAASAFSAGVSGARKMIAGMKTLKGAIAATGVGLLVVALGTLVQWFSTSEKGAKAFATAGYALEALFKNLTDRLNTFLESDLVGFFENPQQAIKDLGKILLDNIIKRFEGIIMLVPRVAEAVVLLFQGEFEEAAKVAGNAVLQISTGLEDTIGAISDGIDFVKEVAAEVVEETKKAIKQGDQLANLEDRLAKATAAFTIEQARLNTEIDKQQKIIDDTTRSFDDRAAALDKQSELSLKLAQEIANQAALEESTIRARLALTANYKESLALQQELADAQADRIEKEAQVSIVELENAQKRREIDLEELERKKSIAQQIEDLRLENLQDERGKLEQELLLQEERAMQELELLKGTEEEKAALREQYLILRNAKLQEYDDAAAQAQAEANAKQIADEKALRDSRISITQDAVGTIGDISAQLAEGTGRNAKKAFEISKIAGIAQAIISTAQAVTAQLAVPQDALTGANFVKAGIAAATGIAQVAKIKSTSFGGGGGGGVSVSAPSPSQSAPSVPSVNFDFLQQGAQQTTIQAYVVEQNVSSTQQANQLIQDQAAL